MRCQVTEPTQEWPYIRRCRATAAFQTDTLRHGDPDLNDTSICYEHNQRFLDVFPERTTTPLTREEGPTPLEK